MRILRLNEVMDKTGLKKTSIYKLINNKAFPEALALGERAVGWLESEIDSWITERIKQRNLVANPNSPE